ncbi:MAG TPA: hypothetical protein VLI04_03835 [Nocardioidaceae bacterium]|nr:hypothetical protein [Nocardioidaceae bacterium]
MRNHTIRNAAIAVLAAAATTIGGATAFAGGQAVAADSPPVTTKAETPVDTTSQVGVVLEGFATIAEMEAYLEVYDNSRFGSSVRLIVGDLEDGGFFGYAEQQTAFVVNGQLHATVELDGRVASIEGTLVENGKPTRIRESMQDGGEQLVTRGTNTQLLANVTITFEGATIPVEVGTAFGYDLQVRTVDLYGTN